MSDSMRVLQPGGKGVSLVTSWQKSVRSLIVDRQPQTVVSGAVEGQQLDQLRADSGCDGARLVNGR
ncbi:MAG: hypothetical protein IPK39_02040 [Sulfuritalea sp.]|nr:hypothetical protein [Sulfuritalea sp.]